MDRMRMESAGLTERNIETLGKLFPGCVTETADARGRKQKKVNFDLLRQMLSEHVLDGGEAYEFNWVGKKAAAAEAGRPARKTLRPCRDRSVDWDTTGNLYIEGDNLEVLKLLQESYRNRIKMIYIDPPYNTGHDFVYPDSFIMNNRDYNEGMGYFDEEGNVNFGRENSTSEGRYHSDWCSMMYSRLMLARNLLTEDGFIAISIGEEEAYNLRKICNELFGEANFRNVLAVRRYNKNLNLQFAARGLFSMNVGLEYILIYSKNTSSKMKAVYREASGERSRNGYWKGFWNNADRPTMRYDILGVTPTDGQWKWKREVAEEAVANYREYEAGYQSSMTLEEYWIKTGKCKRFIRKNPGGTGKNQGIEHWVAPAKGILRSSNWADLLISRPAGMGIRFDSPKNPDVIRELIELFQVQDGDIVLDFFSGSASTAHAVLQKNAADGQRRAYIMVQLEQPCPRNSDAFRDGFSNICQIGQERIRRASDRIRKETGADMDYGFRVFRLDDTNMAEGYYEPDGLSHPEKAQPMVKEDRSDQDLLFQCVLEWGLPLTCPYTAETVEGHTVYDYNRGDLAACFDEEIPDSVVKAMAEKRPRGAVIRGGGSGDDFGSQRAEELFRQISPDTRVRVL